MQTIALKPSTALLTNPAIDKGAANGTTTDQRGFVRVNQPDIGAYEFGGQAAATLKITPSANGKVTSDPRDSSGAITDCSAADDSKCSATYAKGKTVELTATPNNSYSFNKWVGNCSGNNNPISVTMDTNKACEATFTKGAKKAMTLPIDGGNKVQITLEGGGKTCSLRTASIVNVSDLAGSPKAPAGSEFAQGLAKFDAHRCDVGETVTDKITYPENIASGAKLMKWGKTHTNPNNHWYELPATISGKTVTYSIKDGGLGDNDLKADGTITDPAGPASFRSTSTTAHPVPALSPAWLLLMMGMLGVLGFGYQPHRRSR